MRYTITWIAGTRALNNLKEHFVSTNEESTAAMIGAAISVTTDKSVYIYEGKKVVAMYSKGQSQNI